MSDPEPLPPVVNPNAVYSMAELRHLLRLPKQTIAVEIRAGRLRVCRLCRSYRILGTWVQQWLEECELTRYRKKAGR